MLLVPRHEKEFAAVGTVAEVSDRVRLPGGARAVALAGPAPRRRRRRPDAARRSPVRRGRGAPDEVPVDGRRATWSASTAPSSRRSSSCAATTAASPPSCARSPSPGRWPTPRLLARPDLRAEGRAAADRSTSPSGWSWRSSCQRERLAELQVRKRIRDDVESGAEKQQREYFLRKQMDSIRKELGEDDALGRRGVPDQDRRGRDARARPRAGRQGARPARADGRAVAPSRA